MLFIRGLFIRDANRPNRIDDHDHGTNDENQKTRVLYTDFLCDQARMVQY